MDILNEYSDKPHEYFEGVRYDLIPFVPENAVRILEIGCSNGGTLAKLKALNSDREIVGIDLFAQPEEGILDEFFLIDVEHELELPLRERYFDVLVLGDVIEHFWEPEKVLKNLMRYLKKGGLIIASIPNFQQWKNITEVFLKGDFHYKESGILDRTHKRFYCKKNIVDLFESIDLCVEHIAGNYDYTGKKYLLIKWIPRSLLDRFLTEQFIITGKLL